MRTTEHDAKIPSAKTGLSTTLSGLHRAKGTSASAHRRARLLIALTLALAALALAATPAFAVTTHVFTPPAIGSAGSGDGQVSLVSNSGVAVNSTSHDVYVADTGNARVDQFSSTGTFIRAFGADVGGSGVNVCTTGCVAGTPGSAPGAFTTPTFIAVDNVASSASFHDVYVGDTTNNVVTKFDASGALIESWGVGGSLDGSGATDGPFGPLAGIAVDGTGDLWVYAINAGERGQMFEFSSSGAFITDWNSGFLVSPVGIAVDTSGNLYVVRGNPFVEKFDGSGNDLGTVDAAGTATGLAIDPSTDDLYVGESGTSISHFAAGCTLPCTPSDSFGSGHLAAAAGLAVDSSDHTVFAADSGNQQIAAFTGPVTLPDATTNAATSIGKHGATLNGHLDPAGGGDITDCHFEYTDDASFQSQGFGGASTIACDQVTPISSPTDVTASPSGLDPGTTYHFRLLAGNANGSNDGGDQTFTTDPAVNLIISAASAVTATTATLNGHVDSNGGGDITDCHFEYTDDAAFQSQGFGGAQSAPCTPATPISSPTDVSAGISGLTAETTYHVRLVATNGDGTTATGDQPFTTIPAVTLTIAPANPVGATTATLNGHVDSNGGGDITDCHFSYIDDAAFQSNGFSGAQSAPCTPATPISSPTDVSADISGLTTETTYHVRLVATNSFGTSRTGDQPFTTLPRPHIDFAAAQNLTPTEADLVAKINPEGFDTTYHFEWGTANCASNPCTSVPVPDADIGSGSSDVTVSTHLTGLTQSTTYHWRIIATSANGSVGADADHTFIYDTTGQGLPDNRAYEQVTPVEKNGALLGSGVFTFSPTVADDGSRLTTTTIQCFADSVSCNASRGTTGSLYGFTRSSGGWAAHQIALPSTQFAASSSFQVTTETGAGLFAAPTAPGGEDDFYVVHPDGTFSDIGPVTPPAGGPQGVPVTPKASADFSEVVFASQLPIWPFDLGTGRSLYQYSGTGNSQPALVGVAGGQGATDLISACGTQFPGRAPGPVSADGGTVYFLALGQDDGSCRGPSALTTDQLYARIDGTGPGAHTVAISQPSLADCTTPACTGSAPSGANFEGASADGSRAFFTSTQQLTDAASEDSAPGDGAVDVGGAGGHGCPATTGPNGCNLYLYDFANPAGHELTAISVGDSSGNGPRVQGVFAVSRDGSHVYFVAKGVLAANSDANGHSAQSGANNLYGYDASTGATSFIAALPDSDQGLWQLSPNSSTTAFGANVTPDGRFLVFPSRGNLTPDDTSRSAARQIFRYDAQTGELIRISLGNDGFNDNGNRSAPTPCGTGFCAEDASIPVVNDILGHRTDPTMSHDGSYVFFMSPVALTPHALDGVRIGTNNLDGVTPVYAQNVYEWHAGHVSLISDGRDTTRDEGQNPLCSGTSSVCLIAADGSGQNVFFSTADRLVPQDTDTSLDYYDARVGGGIPFTPPPEPCSGDNCKPVPSGTPPDQTPGSSALNGPGNVHQTKCKKGFVHKHGKCVKKHHKRRHHHKRANTNRRAGK